MTIYTGRGDEGMTDLADMSRVPKTSPRIEAYGTVDELNGLVGTIRPTGYQDLDERLVSVQNHLHIVQADLSNPDPGDDAPVVTEEHVERLEDWIDEAQAEVGPLQRFIIPSGGNAGAPLHHARAVCRRAERRVIEAAEDETLNESIVVYLNRLSDALFVFGRVANHRDGIEELEPRY
ncbi:cob(I)yrinic acid a,c-diamide adenosyltransferase [Halanaeroarchaeum sp. HSR-CO]|uniref:cob(I)yrinic acid a,c-diamide adenosyltransferase n=1 Tax=Halanaeroarchaeum sp. HSR-CO TaxID=2866382 RepID=UPI00217D975F|nr:cob(I)yrinic acid a,c-diamide adenosyltransferase [Halanaeroarchaeum sp. HSR-CO]